MEEYGRWEADSVSGGKFWSISRDGTNVTTSWGKLGSSGQSNTKSFASEEKAIAMITSTILKKEKEGYVKQGGKKRKDAATHQPVVKNSDETLDTVSLPGAAFPLFELQSFEFTLGEDGKTFTFQFSTKEVKRKIGKEDEDEDEEEEKEDEEEEEGGDWKSRSAWENYGPGCSMEHDFGTLTSKRKVDLKKLPTEVQFADDEDEPLGIYCMDHQAAKRNKISFLAATGKDRFHLVWTGVIVVDDDNNSAKPFRIETKNAIFKQQDE